MQFIINKRCIKPRASNIKYILIASKWKYMLWTPYFNEALFHKTDEELEEKAKEAQPTKRDHQKTEGILLL